MEFSIYPQPFSWPYLLASPSLYAFPYNYVHWAQTPEAHIYSADLPGVRKEEIKVEVENSKYLVIRTDAIDESSNPAKSFKRKFRLPGLVDIDGISAGYEDGVLKVIVPRSYRRGLLVDPATAMSDRLEVTARAA